MINKNTLNWKVAGFAGEGIMTTGLLMSKTCAKHGWYIFDYTEYPSLIRGGHNTYQVHAGPEPIHAQKWKVDVLVALNKNGLAFHKEELTSESMVIFDQEDDNVDISIYNLAGKNFNVPMVKLAQKVGGSRVMANNVALGASVFFLGLDLSILNQVIAQVFSDKGQEVINLNQKAAQAGYDFVKSNGGQPVVNLTKKPGTNNRLTLTGNEATGLGALAGGLSFYAAYPMTPSSSLLHYLAAKASKAGIVVKHAENENSAVNMAIGASFAGVKAMVGTAGGGFCYMTEGLGFASVAELPLVVFEGMRPGPALGMPTWTAQGDLAFVLSASQDEFPRIVLTPGDAEEAFLLVQKALDLAEKYQLLVIVVSDKYLAESRFTMPKPKTSYSHERMGIDTKPQADESGFYPRYRTDQPVSQRTLPGTANGGYIANSYEHDKYGFATEEGPERAAQMEKRMKKMELATSGMPEQYYEADAQPQVTLLSFGSTKNPIRAARELLHEEGIESAMLNFSWLWPFPKDQVTKVLNSGSKILVVEGNYQGQLARLITQETGIKVSDQLHRYDGRPFFAEDIVSYVKGTMLKKKL